MNGTIKYHANVSMVPNTFGGWDGSKHFSEFMCELISVFVDWLHINLGDFKFLNKFLLSCLMPMVTAD